MMIKKDIKPVDLSTFLVKELAPKSKYVPTGKPKGRPAKPKGPEIDQRLQVKHVPIAETLNGKALSVYLVLHPNGKHIATIQVFYSYRSDSPKMMALDVYMNGSIYAQVRSEPEEYPFSRSLAGLELAEVRLYDSKTPIGPKDSALKGFEREFYLPGLDRLKGKGYKIIKAI